MSDRMNHNEVMYWSSDGAYDAYSIFFYVSILFLWLCTTLGAIFIFFGFLEIGFIIIFAGLFSATLLTFLEMKSYEEMRDEYQEKVIDEAIDD